MAVAGGAPPAAALSEVGERALRRVRRRIMPVVVLLYFVAYLDRNNIGFAQTSMSEDLGLSGAAFGFGAGVFFIGYALLEIPSNGAMHRFGARRWIARILLTWGVFAVAMAFVQGETSLYVIRFLLGAAEAGFFPAVVLYLTWWFPAAQRVAVLGIFILAQPLSNMVGAPVSGLLLLLDGVAGLQGWQWLFIVEGVPALVLGVLAPRLLTDRPRDAHWLADDERAWLVDATEAEARAKEAQGSHRFVDGLKDRRALAFAALYFGLVIGIYGLSFWLPTTVEALGDFGTVTASLITAIPYAVAAVFTYLWGRSSDRRRERVGHVAIAELLAAVGLLASGYLLSASPVLAVVALSVAAMGIYGSIGPFLEMPSAALAGAAAASGIALVNSIGNLGGFVAPYVVGALRDATGSSRAGLLFLSAVLAVTALATWLYGRRTGAGLPPAELPPTPVRAQEGR